MKTASKMSLLVQAFVAPWLLLLSRTLDNLKTPEITPMGIPETKLE